MTNGYIKGRPDVTWWLQQIHAGIKFRKKLTHQARWDTWRKYYGGDWNSSTLPVNLFFKMARTVVPRVYFRNPGISISPAKPGMLNWAFAQLLERIDNKLMRQMRLKSTFKDIVGNSWFFSTGVAKVGFGGQYNLNTEDHGKAAPTNRSGYNVEADFHVQDYMPWVDSVHPGNFIVPDQLIRFHKTSWCAEWIQRPLQDVKDDTRFKNTADLKGSAMSNRADYSNEFKTPRDISMLDLIEIHDMRSGKVIVIAPFATDRVLYFGDDDMQFFGRPNYMPVIFNERDNAFWGVPDSKILEPEQLEINEIRTMMMMHWRLSVMKVLYQKGKVDPAEIQKIVDGEIMTAIGVKGDVRAAIDIMQAGDIPDSLFKADAIINQDVRESQGFSRNEFGDHTPASSRTTATESKIVKMASEIRVDERRDMVADQLLEVMEHTNRIIFNHWDEEQVVDIVGPLGVPLWIKFSPSMLNSGAYNIKIDPDTSLPETKDSRQVKATNVYSILKDNPLIDPIRLTRYYLHELHGVQFDDMMRGFPPGVGGPSQPLELEQYIKMATQISQKVPQALISPRQDVG